MVPKLERRLSSPRVVAQHSSEPLSTLDRATTAETIVALIDQSVANPLVVSLTVIVLDVFANDSPKMTFAERNHLADTL